jgi:hypothetical protein
MSVPTMFSNPLVFTNNRQRRVGLGKNTSAAGLLRISTTSKINVVPPMVRKKAAKGGQQEGKQESVLVLKEEDINRPPESASDEEENSADIKPTTFVSKSESPQKGKREKDRAKRKPQGDGKTSNGSDTNEGLVNRVRARPRRTVPLPSSSQSTSSPKRKASVLGKGMQDEFGRITATTQKKKQKTFSSQSSKIISQNFKRAPSLSSGSSTIPKFKFTY